MLANRMQFIVFFHGKQVLEKLSSLPVDISYISEKQGYVIIYADKDQEQTLKKQLKSVKGYKHFGPSHLFDEGLNF